MRQWQQQMADAGTAPATIGLKLSAVSSFYSFVINEKRMAFGVEMCLFVDALAMRSEPVPLRQHHPPEGEQRAGAPAPCSRRSLAPCSPTCKSASTRWPAPVTSP